MKTIYLNANFECSVTEKADTVQTVQTDFFDGKCDSYIEGYRFVPDGQSWQRSDGAVFQGQMISPYKDSMLLEEMQRLYQEIDKGQEAQNSAIAYIGMMTEVI